MGGILAVYLLLMVTCPEKRHGIARVKKKKPVKTKVLMTATGLGK